MDDILKDDEEIVKGEGDPLDDADSIDEEEDDDEDTFDDVNPI